MKKMKYPFPGKLWGLAALMLVWACSEPLEILESSVIKGPYGPPLTAQINLKTSRPCKIRLELFEKNRDDVADISKTFDAYDTLHEIPVLGLYSNHKNRLRISFLDQNGKVLLTDKLTIETDSVPTPKLRIHIDSAVHRSKKYFLSSPLRPPSYIYDRKGEVRGYYHGRLLRALPNGNYLHTFNNEIEEITPLGEEVKNFGIPAGYHRFHHELYQLPNGNLLIGAEQREGLENEMKTRHMALELGKETGDLIYEWNLENFADSIGRVSLRDYPTESRFHFNAVVYDPADSSLIFSGRHQGILKVGYHDKQLKWFFTPRMGFKRSPSDVSDHLLTAVDEQGNPYDDDVQSNKELDTDEYSMFYWPIRQHTPVIVPSDDGLLHLLVLNNEATVVGRRRKNLMIEYVIDEQKKTVSQYRIFDHYQYAKKQSGVDYDPGRGYYLMFSALDVGVLTEFDREGNVIFQAKIPLSGYRMNYLESFY